MAKRRIRSTEKMARSYEAGGFTDERNARLGAVRSRSAPATPSSDVTVQSSTAASAQPGASQGVSSGGGGFLPLSAAPGNTTAHYALTQRDLGLPNGRVIGDSQEIDAVTRAPGRLSLELRDGSIGTARLADEAVTYAKIQHMTTDRLLGRDTASTGDVEELTVGGGLEFTGSGGIQRAALTGDVTASAGSGTTTIANDAVTYAKIQNVTAARLLGRYSASSGDMEELDVAAPLTVDSGGKLLCSAPTVTVNGAATATAVDFDDATPAVTAGTQNVTWSKDSSSPINISAKVMWGATLFKVLSAAANVNDNTSAQNWFPSSGSVTLTVNRAYYFEGQLRIVKGTGVATDILVGFAGTATYTIDWWVMGQASNFNLSNNTQGSTGRTTTTQVSTTASNTSANAWVDVRGIVRCTGAGTLAPQFQFTAAPGGGPQAMSGTRFTLTELGADTVTERGTWS